MNEVSEQLALHISDKIDYHTKLLEQNQAVEKYEQCAIHRDEIIRLKRMLNGKGHYQEQE